LKQRFLTFFKVCEINKKGSPWVVDHRPVTSLGHQEGRKFPEGSSDFLKFAQYFKYMSNTCFQGGRKIFYGLLRPPGYGPGGPPTIPDQGYHKIIYKDTLHARCPPFEGQGSMPPLSGVPAYRYQHVTVSLQFLPRCLRSTATCGKTSNVVT